MTKLLPATPPVLLPRHLPGAPYGSPGRSLGYPYDNYGQVKTCPTTYIAQAKACGYYQLITMQTPRNDRIL
ncbi:MAG: hypothetical protein WC476_12205 [Phycisphaerae bacterium]